MPSKMTRRKQNAPKRLKSTQKAGSNLTSHQSVNSSQVTSESGAGEGDGEEDEGDTTSDEENVVDLPVDTSTCHLDTSKWHLDTPKIQFTSRPGNETDSDSADSSENRMVNFLEGSIPPKICLKIKSENNCDRDIIKSTPPITQEKVNPGSSQAEKCTPWKSQSPASKSCGNRYKYSCKLSPPIVSSSPVLALSSLDNQMALIMSSIPLGLLSRVKNSPSPHDPALTYISAGAGGLPDDQPLDLSKKPERSQSVSSYGDKAADSKLITSCGAATTTSASTSNGFSSLQSLQQRFGGDYPLGLSQKSSSTVIPLQSSVIHKSAVVPHTLPMPADALMRSGTNKSKPGPRSDWSEKQEVPNASAVSPLLKGGNSRHTSPLLIEDGVTDIGGKHTIHRCSCQKSFNTLYAMSLHLQETGHTPGSSKSASLMDYPKLVRGQDMWLNQESEQTRRILRCMQCGESFKSLPLLTVHMMQTQHYTKIVSSDHGRRSHKCSTYCDRELDKECIFKCKICHEAFTDMEGLANHMIVSGHHKKQSSRQAPNSTELSGDTSSTPRQGRRKRFLPDDIISGTCPSSMASLMDSRQKQSVNSHGGMNGFHPDSKNHSNRSSEVQSFKLVQCDSCGKNLEPREFDSHVRACLKHRAEVIDALKNKLAVEEALLSKSESKLLRSGFRLSSLSGHREFMFTNSGSKDDHEDNYEKNHEDNCTDNSNQDKCERISPVGSQSSAGAEHRPLPKTSETNAKICHLTEVPLRTWYCSRDDSEETARGEDNGTSDSRNNTGLNVNKLPQADSHKVTKKEDIDKDVLQDNRCTLSPNVGEKRKLSVTDSVKDSFCNIRKKDRISPSFIQESSEESLDFTSSALHKLDMFSRGLKFSPPRRTTSPEPRLPLPQSTRVSKKKEPPSSIAKSPLPASTPPLPQMKLESPDPPKANMTFDIIDPNADSGATEMSSSALEAMESFIHKSFSVKSDLRSSNLASMFSPFRNCLPLLGSLPGQTGALPDSADRTMSHFAKFSKFFGIVPGVSSFPEPTPLHSGDSNKPEGAQPHLQSSSLLELRHGASLDKSVLLSKRTPIRPHMPLSAIKIPVVKFPSDHLSGHSSNNFSKISAGKKTDIFPSSKKYRYSAVSSLDALISPSRNQSHCQGSSQSSGKTDAGRDSPDSSYKTDKIELLSSEMDITQEEPKKKRKYEFSSELEVSELTPRNISSDEDKDKKVIEKTGFKIKEEAKDSPEDVLKCPKNEEHSLVCSHQQNLKPNRQTGHSQTCQQEVHSKFVEDVSSDFTEKTKLNKNIEVHLKNNLLSKCQTSVKLEVIDDDNRENQFNKSDNDSAGMCDDSSSSNQNMPVTERSKEDKEELGQPSAFSSQPVSPPKEKNWLEKTAEESGKLPTFSSQSVSSREKSWFEQTAEIPGGINYHNCDGDVDTDDDSDNNSTPASALLSSVRKNKEKRKKIKTREIETKTQNTNDLKQVSLSKISSQQCVVSAVVVKNEEVDNIGKNNVDSNDENNYSISSHEKETNLKLHYSLSKQFVESHHITGDKDRETVPEKDKQKNQWFEPESTATKVSEPSATVSRPSQLLYPRSPLNSDNSASSQGDICRDHCAGLLEEKPIFNHHITTKNSIEDVDKQEKQSALDSLSSFVYSQPLTSEHPLDSLHRLLSTNDLAHLASDPHKYSAATSNKCLTPDLPVPLNLTSKGVGLVNSGGCSSDDNEDGDPALGEGGANEGDLREYKCAACNRKFASKGSYRYHLSRCHLSSVKKYGIKEAFNMSPYVYLPLDHTAKFSKYYQLAHELANKGK